MFATTPRSQPAFESAFARDIAEGLSRRGQKKLPPTWFYDEAGSDLFEAITRLPEYGLTRAEERLLARASDDIVREAGSPRLIAELGSGSGAKTRNILEAALRESYDGLVTYAPIDLSLAALDACSTAFGALPGLRVQPVAATYFAGISDALGRRRSDDPALVLFLGSTIGNFTRNEVPPFLSHVRSLLLPGDFLLVGADLVKPAATLIAAYDDSAGITAAFNLNLLERINRELEGEFDVHRFAHEARWNARARRIEMHLRSEVTQEVRVKRLDKVFSFTAGETIWTESSHKFRAGEIARLGERAGWRTTRQWTDYDWGFSETLFRIP